MADYFFKPTTPQPSDWANYDEWTKNNKPFSNDTEKACVVPPWEECIPDENECVCVTNDDVERWNEISALSSISGLDLSDLSSISGLVNSAEYWNSNYDTTSSNSAYWSSHSAYIEQIESLSGDLYNLSGVTSGAITKIYTDKSISGLGTEDEPFYVSRWSEYQDLLDLWSSKYQELYYENDIKNWVSSADLEKDVYPQFDKQWKAIGANETQIQLLWRVVTDGESIRSVTWKEFTNEDISSLTSKNTIYYKY